ncbi:hypothetical protein [Rhizorhabdus histidinilytica]|uniref:hypothetical protein n=1 Tax=Rhizorhabdus histidinilytica TaxID=439228 RepID=UPI0032206C03
MAMPELCAAPDCDKPARQNRYNACSMHEARMRRGGSFEPRQPIKSLADHLGGCSRFGSWEVLGEGKPYQRKTEQGRRHGRQRTALCRCDCGTERHVPIQILKAGKSHHCGCRNGEKNAELHGTHLMSATPEHRSWAHMKERCFNENCADYPDYGGRGITVCDRWRDSFEAFFADMGPRPSIKHSIDRIDVNRNYDPGNCRWATNLEQAQNKRDTRWVLFRGQRMSMREACRLAELDAKYKVIHARVHRRGMTLEQAMAIEGVRS